MNTSEKRRTRPGEMIAFLCEGLTRRRRWIFRIGCAALVLALIAYKTTRYPIAKERLE